MTTSQVRVVLNTKFAWYVKLWLFFISKSPCLILNLIGERLLLAVTELLIDRGVSVEVKEA
jgi:hypothetical protein